MNEFISQLSAQSVAILVCFGASIIVCLFRIVKGLFKGKPKKPRFNLAKIRKWSIAIRKRDEKCVLCSSKKNGQAHHLYDRSSYPSRAYDLSNGVRLCKPCHREFHSWMGGTAVSCRPEHFHAFKRVWRRSSRRAGIFARLFN